MGMLENKRLLITGILTDSSLAFAVAQLALSEGAELVIQVKEQEDPICTE